MRIVDQSLYTKEYYLTDATKYGEFKRSYGKLLEPRLKIIFENTPEVKG